MLKNKERKEGVGRREVCSFSMLFGKLMSSENLSNLNKILSKHNCSFFVSWSSFNGKWNIISNFLSDSYNVLCLLVLNQPDFC